MATVMAVLGMGGAISPARASGVGDASWTPSTSLTEARSSDHLVAGDAITFETTASWSRAQRDGLGSYVGTGLRYTHEVNDRSGRLSATGYWATNHPDPAYDRDDDDGDGRWEEAEITAGAELPQPGRKYVSLLQFSRWQPKQGRRRCGWAWDRRRGRVEVLSQLSRDLLGEWQAERYTLSYGHVAYPRVGARQSLEEGVPDPECGPRGPLDPSHAGVVVTFDEPLDWASFMQMAEEGGRWTAFEAIGSNARDALTWTCGGPVEERSGLDVCEALGVDADGVVAAGGYFDAPTTERIRANLRVARVDALRDPITDLLDIFGGFGVEPPDLTLNDAYWQLIGTSPG